jgi:hypothetical protein
VPAIRRRRWCRRSDLNRGPTDYEVITRWGSPRLLTRAQVRAYLQVTAAELTARMARGKSLRLSGAAMQRCRTPAGTASPPQSRKRTGLAIAARGETLSAERRSRPLGTIRRGRPAMIRIFHQCSFIRLASPVGPGSGFAQAQPTTARKRAITPMAMATIVAAQTGTGQLLEPSFVFA